VSANIVDRVRAFLERRLFPTARLCLGYSGGLDSSVLLHVLAGLRQDMDFQLEAVHVHHGLSPHADAWAEVCARTCAALQVPLTVRHVQVAGKGRGLEAAARERRLFADHGPALLEAWDEFRRRAGAHAPSLPFRDELRLRFGVDLFPPGGE